MVNNLRLGASKSIPMTLCLASWKEASDDWLWKSKTNLFISRLLCYLYFKEKYVRKNNLLFWFELYVALIADSYFELEAHRRYRYPLRRAASAQRTAAITTVMLS